MGLLLGSALVSPRRWLQIRSQILWMRAVEMSCVAGMRRRHCIRLLGWRNVAPQQSCRPIPMFAAASALNRQAALDDVLAEPFCRLHPGFFGAGSTVR